MVKKLASIFSRRKPQRGSGVAYNNSIIKFAEAPKSLEELVHPKYKGKIAMPDPTQHSTTAQWLASLYKILGKDKSDKFIRDLAAMKPILLEIPFAHCGASQHRRDPNWNHAIEFGVSL